MIFWGCITSGFGILLFLFLADQPKSRWFRLTSEQEKIVDERVLDNSVIRNTKVKSDQIIEALREPRLYACILISLLQNLQNGALQTFTSQIIHSMGFSVSEAWNQQHTYIDLSSLLTLLVLWILALDNGYHEHSNFCISGRCHDHRYSS